MHFYSKDFHNNKFIHVVLAVLAAAIAFFVNSLLREVDWRIVGSLSFFSIFAALELIFERFAWKIMLWLPFISLEDFSGNWSGQLLLGKDEKPYPASISVRQNWSKILVEFESDDALGKSFSASIFFDRIGDQRLELSYIYYARSKNLVNRNYFDHYGTAILYLDEEGRSIKGVYYTEKSRNSYGQMILQRT